MTTRKPINEARKALDSDLDGLTNTATKKEMDRPWIPNSQDKAELEAARAKPQDTETQAAQIARISSILEKR